MKVIPLLIAVLVLFAACDTSSMDVSPSPPEHTAELPDVTESDPADISNPFEGLETRIIPDGKTADFYRPSSAAFDLRGLDAALFDKVVSELLEGYVNYWLLAIPVIGLLGTFPSEEAYPAQDDGGTCYVLSVIIHFFEDIYPNDRTQVKYGGTFIRYCRITLVENAGLWRCTDIYVQPEGGQEPEERIKKLWGPLGEPADDYNDENMPPAIREFPISPATDYNALLEAYGKPD